MGRPTAPFSFVSILCLSAAAAAQSSAAGRPVLCDLDGDGLPDLYATAAGRDDVLLKNAGDGGFVDVTAASGLAGLRSRQVLTGDLDRDGHPDLLLVTQGGELRLLRGIGELAFQDATREGGVEAARGVGRAQWTDYDRDGHDDLLLETSTGAPVFLHNLGGLAFERVELGLPATSAPGILPANVGEEPTHESPEHRPEGEAGSRVSRPGGRTLVEVDSTSAGVETRGGKAVLPPDPSVMGLGGTVEAVAKLFCAKVVRDVATGSCVPVSSTPTMGMLYPISSNLYVDAATGWVGIGTTSPTADLSVAGTASIAGNLDVLGGVRLYEAGLLQVDLSTSSLAGGQVAVNGVGGGGAVLRGGPGGGGRVDVHGLTGVVASLREQNQAGLLTLWDGSAPVGDANVELGGRHPGGEGGSLVLNHAGNGTQTVELLADNGSDAGSLALIDQSPGAGNASAYLSAGGFGTGGYLLLSSGNGQAGLSARGGNAGEGGVLTLNDASGLSGVTANGELGGSANLTLWDALAPGVTLDSVLPGGTGGSIALHHGSATNVLLQGNAGSSEGRIVVGDGTADTVELSGRYPGGVGGSLVLYDRSSVFDATATMRMGFAGGHLLLDSQTGGRAVDLRGGGADSGGSLTLFQGNGNTGVRIDGNPEAASISLSDDRDRAVEIEARRPSGTGGWMSLRSANRNNVELQADAGNSEGRIFLRDGSLGGSPRDTVELSARRDGTGDGGTLTLFNEKSELTARLLGDEGNDSGRLMLWNEEGANSFVGASLRAVAAPGQGAQLRLRDEANTLTVDLDATSGGVPTNTGVLTLREGDGSIAWRMLNDVFEGRNSAGAVTISYNRNTGAKNAVVATERYGQRYLYCEESTEVWFSDHGGGRTHDGTARIELDPVFLETVVIDDEHPMRVFITPTAPIGEYWVEKRGDGFVLHAPEGAEASFDWRVMAKRRGLAGVRLEAFGTDR